jgi:hypothetical protein
MDFVERWFGIFPDGGSGTFEMSLLFLAVAAVSVILVFRAQLIGTLRSIWRPQVTRS